MLSVNELTKACEVVQAPPGDINSAFLCLKYLLTFSPDRIFEFCERFSVVKTAYVSMLYSKKQWNDLKLLETKLGCLEGKAFSDFAALKFVDPIRHSDKVCTYNTTSCFYNS